MAITVLITILLVIILAGLGVSAKNKENPPEPSEQTAVYSRLEFNDYIDDVRFASYKSHGGHVHYEYLCHYKYEPMNIWHDCAPLEESWNK